MVRGIEIFRRYFKDFSDNYILIGGAACDEHLTDKGLNFRATKDLDIMLIVEALGSDFLGIHKRRLLRKQTEKHR